MSYLYGDATTAPLEVNYIEFLRDSLEFSVELLMADQQMRGLGKKDMQVRGAADAEVRRIEELAKIVARAMESAPVGAEGSPTATCAQAIVRAAAEQVRLASEGVRAQTVIESGKITAQDKMERERAYRALEKLLLANDLPDTSYSLQLAQQGGVRYAGRVATSAGAGLDVVLELEIPSGGSFSQIARVDRFVQGLDVHAPEAGGFFRKETKMKPQRIDRLHVVELAIGEGGTFKLRANPDGTGGGFDVAIDGDQQVRVTHVSERGESAALEANAHDPPKLLSLWERLVAAGAEVRHFRKRLLDAKLDGDPFIEHEEPTVLVERLVEEMAPVVQEIARRSKSTEELVLKRITGDKRREEIFISKAELLQRLSPLPSHLRDLFKALGLEEQKPSTRPPPVVKGAPSRRPPPIPAPVEEAPDLEVGSAESAEWETAEPVVAPPSPPPTSQRKPT